MTTESPITDRVLGEPITKFISKDVAKVRFNDPVSAAIAAYKKTNTPAVLVVDENESLVGLITDEDLTKLADLPSGATAGQIATTGNSAIKEDATVADLLSFVKTLPDTVKVVPVVNNPKEKRPVGIVLRDRLKGDITETVLQAFAL